MKIAILPIITILLLVIVKFNMDDLRHRTNNLHTQIQQVYVEVATSKQECNEGLQIVVKAPPLLEVGHDSCENAMITNTSFLGFWDDSDRERLEKMMETAVKNNCPKWGASGGVDVKSE